MLSIVFLFLLAEALRHERLLDLYELLARLLVATSIAFLIALIFYFLAVVLGQFQTMYLNVVLAAIVIILIFDPLRERVEGAIQRFFRERFDLESSIALLRRRLAHILEVDEMGAIVMAALDQSRRVTGAGLYLRDQDATGFNLLASLGPRVPRRVEVATGRARSSIGWSRARSRSRRWSARWPITAPAASTTTPAPPSSPPRRCWAASSTAWPSPSATRSARPSACSSSPTIAPATPSPPRRPPSSPPPPPRSASSWRTRASTRR